MCKSEFVAGLADVEAVNDELRVDCSVCGWFRLTSEAWTLLSSGRRWEKVQRSAAAHVLSRSFQESGERFLVTGDFVRLVDEQRTVLPDPIAAADNLIRYIGDCQRATGDELSGLNPDVYAIAGYPDLEEVHIALLELQKRGVVNCVDRSSMSGPVASNIRLSMDGWRVWKEIIQGKHSSGEGFIAMQFGDPELDQWFEEVIQPRLAAAGFPVRRITDKPRAGIIDNLIRADLQDAAFVLVELSHNNSGAYWEAGYAEGLSKPVIYMCEKSQFDDPKTKPHFDVNHCQCVIWESQDPDAAVAALVATLRNSVSRH